MMFALLLFAAVFLQFAFVSHLVGREFIERATDPLSVRRFANFVAVIPTMTLILNFLLWGNAVILSWFMA